MHKNGVRVSSLANVNLTPFLVHVDAVRTAAPDRVACAGAGTARSGAGGAADPVPRARHDLDATPELAARAVADAGGGAAGAQADEVALDHVTVAGDPDSEAGEAADRQAANGRAALLQAQPRLEVTVVLAVDGCRHEGTRELDAAGRLGRAVDHHRVGDHRQRRRRGDRRHAGAGDREGDGVDAGQRVRGSDRFAQGVGDIAHAFPGIRRRIDCEACAGAGGGVDQRR